MNYWWPLNSAEYIFSPLHDPDHSHWIPIGIESDSGSQVSRDTLWDSTVFYWSKSDDVTRFRLSILSAFDARFHEEVIICASFPKQATIQVALLDRNRKVCSNWSIPVQGQGIRQEIIYKISDFLKFWDSIRLRESTNKFHGLSLKISCQTTEIGALSLNWLGVRCSKAVVLRNKLQLKARESLDWSPWILPHESWGDIAFERGLLFDEKDLENVRQKLTKDGWKENFSLLEARAAEYMKHEPESYFNGECLPNYDERYIRTCEHDQTAYHWEALVVAFVGLVRKDKGMIDHALRYLMCMVHTRYWAESAEHCIASSTWTHQCFMEEMTTTSVSILFDWLGFALFPRTKKLIRKAIYERGIAPVTRVLSSQIQIHKMNQGIVFNRGLILGGLMLEVDWLKYSPNNVNYAYETMGQVLQDYIREDGGVHEGTAYFCEIFSAALWSIIAFCRARDLDWQDEVIKYLGSVDRYVATMSASHPGKVIPSGDCRVEWFGGDLIPILATVSPESPFCDILRNCLVEGWVHELTGALAKSGGMIGMVYGPDNVTVSRSVVPDRDILPISGKVSVSLGGKDNQPKIRVWASGSMRNLSHTHRDVAQFCLEVNEQPVFLDRGMVQYWFSEAHFLSRSWLHNVLTPIAEDGSYVNQSSAQMWEEIRVNDEFSQITIPGTGVWHDYMNFYERKFLLNHNDVLGFSVVDSFNLVKARRVAFHLHSKLQFETSETSIKTAFDGIEIEVVFPWARDISCQQTLIDFSHNPVNHICVESSILDGNQNLDSQFFVRHK